jgi:hypothetical protein
MNANLTTSKNENEYGKFVFRSIETAPKDGSWVLLAGGSCLYDEGDDTNRVVSAKWTTELNSETVSGYWQFACYDGGFYGVYDCPTHWMPLPCAPKSE